MTTSTIGTNGTYPTLQAWIDACPADLRPVTGANTIWRGECKRQLFTSAGTLLTIANILTDDTHYVELTTEADASFRDNATKQTDPLRYDASKGAALSCTGPYAYAIRNLVPYTRISNLMIQQTSTQGYSPVDMGTNMSSWLDSCIVEGYVSGINGSVAPVMAYGAVTGGPPSKVTNCLIVQRGIGQASIAKIMNGAEAHNCTFVVPSNITPATSGNISASAAPVFINCAFFGCGAVWSQGNAPSFSSCATNVASPPSGCTTVAYNTTTFANITDGTHDYRLPLGSALIGAGSLDPDTPLDIIGTVRTAYDIGCWEYADVTPPSGAGPYYPGSDITVAGVTNSWTPSTGSGTLASMLDDTIPANYDVDYAQSGPTPVNDTFEVKFAGVQAPPIGSTVQIIYRIKAAGTVQLTVTLRCGPSDAIIATWIHNPVQTQFFDAIVQTLAPAEQALITDYTDLRLRFAATVTG